MKTPEQPKLVVIVTEAAIEAALLSDLKRLGVNGFTVTDVRGSGSRGNRSGSWEFSGNIRIEIVCNSTLATRLTDFLKENYYDHYAMISYSFDVSVLRPEKFLL
jgi:nitrogen regulatory protein PII